MPSQNTLVWVGAAASAAVIAGASALYWTHPGFLWWNAAQTPVVATAPAEPKPQSDPAALATAPIAAPPVASAPPPTGKPSGEAAASTVEPAFDVVNV